MNFLQKDGSGFILSDNYRARRYIDTQGRTHNVPFAHQQASVEGAFDCDKGIHWALEMLYLAGVQTQYSCEADYIGNKFYSYINPLWGPGIDTPTAKEMATILGLEKGQWRSHNGVLWFRGYEHTDIYLAETPMQRGIRVHKELTERPHND